MPYIVTTEEPERWLGSQPYGSPGESYLPARVTRRAVATLEEARQAVPLRWNVPEGGARITLDDGTVIEVRATGPQPLLDALSSDTRRQLWEQHPATLPIHEIIDAYNAAQS